MIGGHSDIYGATAPSRGRADPAVELAPEPAPEPGLVGDGPPGGQADLSEPVAGEELPAPAGTGTHYLTWSRSGRAKGRRYALVLLSAVVAWAAGTLAVAPLVEGELSTAAVARLAVLTGSFTLGVLTVPTGVRLVLRRPAWSVVTGWWPGQVRHLVLGAGIVLAALLATDLLVTPFAPLHVQHVDLGIWLALAAVGLVGFFIQTGFEELVFRGLMMQAFASRTLQASVVIGVPAALFALLHAGNLAPLSGTVLQFVPYLLMGLTWGWAAWYSGSLWLPWGMHWANNLYATLVMGVQGDVLPAAGPLVRELTAFPLETFILITALQCAVQIVAVRILVPRLRLPGGRIVGTLAPRVPSGVSVPLALEESECYQPRGPHRHRDDGSDSS